MAKRAVKRNVTSRSTLVADSHPPVYEPTADPNTWQECLWSPTLNEYVCHDIPASQVPRHIAKPRKYMGRAATRKPTGKT
jgi:hypothetical protein